MRYGKSNGWLDGQPAAITKIVAKGSITYIGAWLDEETMDAAAKWMVETSGIHPLNISLPKGVGRVCAEQERAGWRSEDGLDIDQLWEGRCDGVITRTDDGRS